MTSGTCSLKPPSASRRGGILIALAVSFLGTPCVQADQATGLTSCAPQITVSAPAAPFAPDICAAVQTADRLLAQCGLNLTRPVVIDVMPEITETHLACAAFYDCAADRLTVLRPDILAETDGIIPIFQNVPKDEYFRSIIIHEMAHAYLDHAADSAFSRVAHEYLAYAMQIAALSEQSRGAALASLEIDGTAPLDRLTEIALAFGVSQFALRSYQHFAQPENGCDFVAQIVADDPDLPADFRQIGLTPPPY